MKALIDGDIVVYRVACSCEKIPTLKELAAMDKGPEDRESLIEIEPLGIAYARADTTIQDMLEETGSDEYIIYLTGDNNFRLDVNKEYKAHRKDVRKPAHFNAVREYLVTRWGATITDGIEADDAMGIEQMKWYKSPTNVETFGELDRTIICTIDKDLDTIPGPHYNFVKKLQYDVSDEYALKFLWKQMLIGDTADNIFGVKGIGPKKADKLIDPLDTEDEMYQCVYDLYNDHERFEMNLACLTILTKDKVD